jgi:hypothetical protein
MHELLSVRAAELSRLATTVRSNLDQAEVLIPVVNRQLAELAAMGVEDLHREGPATYSRPQGLSNGETTDHSIYEAVVVMSVGVGAALWNSTEFDESMSRPYGEPFDLAPRFVDVDQSPPVVKAILVTHASHMVTFLMAGVRLLGS